MNTSLTLLLALCALTAAMVPRNRRAVDPDDPAHTTPPSTTTTARTICAPRTPCGWSVMKPQVKVIDVNITNTYCECAVGTICQIEEQNTNQDFLIQYCIPPVDEDDSG